jgi:hypothetical protein
MRSRRANECRPILAYHITWTSYGQWLHGDTRGYVDRHNRTPGAPYSHGHADVYNVSANRLEEEPVWLSEARLREAIDYVTNRQSFAKPESPQADGRNGERTPWGGGRYGDLPVAA